MSAETNIRPSSTLIEWGVGARALPGEVESGDLHVVAPFVDGTLVAVLDGLGHGAEAAAAARIAAEILKQHAQQPVSSLILLCHEALRKTRGAAMSIASFDAVRGTMTWLGVGNVEGVLFRRNTVVDLPREGLVLRGGVVGYELPLPLHASVVRIAVGDVVILATDGIDTDFARDSPFGRHPKNVAHDILARHAKQTDDALVLVTRYIGVLP